jgi:hypothetical protein
MVAESENWDWEFVALTESKIAMARCGELERESSIV